jgi:hypothetical protein
VGFVPLRNNGDATTAKRDGTAESLKQEPDVPGPVSPDSEGDLNDVPGVISESLDETIRHTGEWLIEKTAEILAHAIAPGAGHLVVLFFEGKELFEDVVALTSSDSPVELHIPLAHLPFEFELEAGVECQAKGDGDEADDGPRLILFMAPGDGGVLGGWALERRQTRRTRRKSTGPHLKEWPSPRPTCRLCLMRPTSQTDGRPSCEELPPGCSLICGPDRSTAAYHSSSSTTSAPASVSG